MTTLTHLANGEEREAVFDESMQHRLILRIIWDRSIRPVQIIGLNPSTATHEQDDPTVRRCKDFARSFGYGGLIMTNLFSFRATDPSQMKTARIPNHPENDVVLMACAKECSAVIAAWGNHGHFAGRAVKVKSLICGMKCFGLTKFGHPKHPLYLAKSTSLFPFENCTKLAPIR